MQKLRQSLVALLFLIFMSLVLAAVISLGNIGLQKLRQNSGSYEVTYVFDGDTIEVSMDGKKQKVRLIGVDTPETGGNDTFVECYGKEATLFTRDKLEGERVILESDPTNDNRDRYGRLLRYVYRKSDGLDINLSLMKEGYSPIYTSFPYERKDEFVAAGDQAKRAGLGLWSACNIPANP